MPRQPHPETPLDAADDRRRFRRRVRLFSLVQFVASAFLSLFLCTGRMMLPSAALELLRISWLILVLPSYLCAAALVIYLARQTGRPFGNWSGELAFWSVLPATAAILLWAF